MIIQIGKLCFVFFGMQNNLNEIILPFDISIRPQQRILEKRLSSKPTRSGMHALIKHTNYNHLKPTVRVICILQHLPDLHN